MIAKAFDKPRPTNDAAAAGWEAEEKMAFLLRRAFEPAADTFVFNNLRLRTVSNSADDDFFQIDHLVLHRHGLVIIESKTTGHGSGEFHVDALGQWQRRPNGHGRAFNFACPFAQAEVQATALRRTLDSATPPLLDKMAGLLQKRFRQFPMRILVALSDQARLTGNTAPWESKVMKAERVVQTIQAEIAAHSRASGIVGALLSTDDTKGAFRLTELELGRVVNFLLASNTPLATAPHPSPAPPRPVAPPSQQQPAQLPAQPPAATVEQTDTETALEALTCRKCSSIRVSVVYRRDYCLLCEECGGYTPLDWSCRRCGKPATIRKRGPDFLRVCDKPGGCGRQIVFWRPSCPQ